jgi:excisionase family DNA binding protein
METPGKSPAKNFPALRVFPASISASCRFVRPGADTVAGTIPANDGEIPNMEQLALTVAEACEAARVGKTVLYQAIASGDLVARKRGRKTLVLPADLRVWIAGLPPIEPKHDGARQSQPR